MSMSLADALRAALDDEYQARATYRAVLIKFGDIRPFVNIVESEARHIEALERLFDRYDLKLPADSWAGQMTAPPSIEAACQAGIDGERANAALYQELIEAAVDYPEVEATFRRLRAASQENHLPAFERGLRRAQGGGVGHDRGCGDGPPRRRRRRVGQRNGRD